MNNKVKIVGGNIKLGNMGSFSKLAGDGIFRTKSGEFVSGSCGKHCEGCRGACYVFKSYRYPSVIENHAKNTKAFRENQKQAFADIKEQLSRKKKPFKVVRINQSGELESFIELVRWIELARDFPETSFYLYTKNYEAVKTVAKNELVTVPKNFTLLVSIWHNYGICEYNQLKKYPWVKAFVYMDGYNYEEQNINIETTCKAYDMGKINHNITCDKCKKCFDSQFKVIGCKEH